MVAVIAAAAILAIASGTAGAVAAGLITSEEIKDGTIRSIDIRDHNVHGRELRPTLAEQIWQDDQIAKYALSSASAGVVPGATRDLTIQCAGGKSAVRALGGGFEVSEGVVVLSSTWWGSGRSWRVVVHNTTDTDQEFSVYVVCGLADREYLP
jgi:hypothetical protein